MHDIIDHTMMNLSPDTEQYWASLVAIIDSKDAMEQFEKEREFATLAEQLEDQEISDILLEIYENIIKTSSGKDAPLFHLLYKYALYCHQFHSENINVSISDVNKCLTELIELSKTTSDTRYDRLLNLFYVLKGVILEYLAYYEQSADSFTQALKREPYDLNALHGRGNVLYQLNNLDEAIRDLNAVIALDPSDSESYVSRGNVFLKLGRAREAILDFTKAIELDNEEIDAYLGRAQAYKSLGMELEARKDEEAANQIEAIQT